ncbi:succinic semialdehyde dehydrogenase [Actinocorallia sp. B10E7]|uniref:succinic semialdehyde dehydrogenase n=1 Tax=Actinocorallia sp. B10E7 TaxID=3153558 RepID=UPI00325CD917
MRRPAALAPGLLDDLAARVVSTGSGEVSVTEVFTGTELTRLPLSTPSNVASAVERARDAQARWAATPVRARARVFARFHRLLLDRREHIADLIQAETGKARAHAFAEASEPVLTTGHYLGAAPDLLRPRRRRGMVPLAVGVTERRLPKGVVAVISPWNYPFALSVSDAVPALLAGNAVLVKPDLLTPLSPLYGARLLAEAGLPEGLMQVVLGDGPVLGASLVETADYVAFTGSTGTGREIGRHTGDRLVGCSLELGGKNAMIVLDDARLGAAVAAAVESAFTNAGQLCMHIERLYVQDRVFEEFRDRFVAATRALRLGARYGWGYDVGSLISPRRLAEVGAHVEDARAKGARVLTGGRPRPDVSPSCYEPTVLAGVEPGMECFDKETFGPVVALYRFGSDDEAVTAANATAYGLNAAVFGADRRRARRVAARLRAGTVNVNDGHMAAYGSMDAPMGGLGLSGLGRRHGAEGLLKYTEAQSLAVQRVRVLQPPSFLSPERHAEVVAASLRLLRALRVR